MLSKITATGCSVTALICAMCASHPSDLFLATAVALAIFGCALRGERPAYIRCTLVVM